MKTQNFISRFIFLTVLFASLFGTSLYAKPLTTDEKAKRKKEVVAMLSGTTWDVELFPMDNPKKKTLKDVVSYEHGRLKSKVFEAEGYKESNLTVTIEDDGKAIWETMQSHESKGPVFWRGELAEKTVNGVLSRQNKDGSTEAYSLRGVQSGTFEVAPEKPPVIIEAPKEVIPPANPQVPAAAAPAVAPAAVNALDALLGKGKASPVTAATPAAANAAAPAKAAVPTPAVAAVKPTVPVTTPVAAATPAKPAVAVPAVQSTAAVVKAEAKPAVQAVTASAEEKKKEKKSKWSW